mmetsp:Transcript_3926/g.11144  ORF Transcript_3926/g.11144 Transcript_3926/m.11144 type:complete len:82 (+) Transcript_3926:1265-1510(+)
MALVQSKDIPERRTMCLVDNSAALLRLGGRLAGSGSLLDDGEVAEASETAPSPTSDKLLIDRCPDEKAADFSKFPRDAAMC